MALLADGGLLYCLVRYCALGALPAASISFMAGAVVAYFLSVRLAFTAHRFQNRRVEFWIFCALGLVGLAVNAGVIAFAGRLGFSLLPAKACAICCTFLCNFVLRRQLLFAAPPDPGDASHVFAK